MGSLQRRPVKHQILKYKNLEELIIFLTLSNRSVLILEGVIMFCYHCGNKTVGGASFCAVCGKPVISQSQPQTPAPKQQPPPEPVRLQDHQSTQRPPAPAEHPLPEYMQQQPPAPVEYPPVEYPPVEHPPAGYPPPEYARQQPPTPASYPPPEYMRQPVKKAPGDKKILMIASIAAGGLIVIGLALFLVLSLLSGSDVEAVIDESVPLAETPEPIIETPEPEPEEPEPTPEPEPVFAPVSFTAYGNGYSITGYEIGTHTDGSASVILYGTGFNILPLRDGEFRVPVWAYLTSGGVEHSSTGCSIEGDQITYNFEFRGTPDTILAVNGETDDVIVTIDVSDGKIASSGAGNSNDPAKEDTEDSIPVAMIPIEYIGKWEGSADGIKLSFKVEPDGTGVYTFEQSGYTESYDFSLEVGSETFSVKIPSNNTLGIVTIEGTYKYSDEKLTLNVITTFSDGREFKYTVPCRKV